jgi:uncharacterized protein YaaR (DUF327 family)
MSTLNTQFEAELKKLISKRIADIGDILCDGAAIKDFADYRKYVGEFQGLKLVHEDFCEQVNTTLNTR